MIAPIALWLGTAALAADLPEAPGYVGLPLADLDAVGLGAPTRSDVSATLRYPLLPLDRSGLVLPLDRSGLVLPLDRSGLVLPLDRSGLVLPLDRLDRSGLVPSGGYAVLAVADTVAAADAAFDRLAESGATHWPGRAGYPPGASGVDRALGDGTQVVLGRSGNAVVLVRDPNGHAEDVRARIVAALVRDEAACAGDGATADGRASDGCGRAR